MLGIMKKQTAKPCERCLTITMKPKWDGYCSHCDEPCQHFPECLCCAGQMEPDKIGKGISFTALGMFWGALDVIPNQWWAASEFGPNLRK